MKFILFYCLLASIQFATSANPPEKQQEYPLGPVVMITGANRGLGFNIVKLLVEDPSVKLIFATYRQKSNHEVKILKCYEIPFFL